MAHSHSGSPSTARSPRPVCRDCGRERFAVLRHLAPAGAPTTRSRPFPTLLSMSCRGSSRAGMSPKLSSFVGSTPGICEAMFAAATWAMVSAGTRLRYAHRVGRGPRRVHRGGDPHREHIGMGERLVRVLDVRSACPEPWSGYCFDVRAHKPLIATLTRAFLPTVHLLVGGSARALRSPEPNGRMHGLTN
jgi:hypothetical protein